MLTNFIITFREAFEITLIIGVILRCLIENNQHHFKKYLIGGVLLGILGCVVGGWLFHIMAGGFEGRSAEIFKGVTQLLGAALLTSVVLWMLKSRGGAGKLKAQTLEKLNKEEQWGVFFLTFISVLKEGVELVVYLVITGSTFSIINTLSVVAGAAGAALLGYTVYRGSKKINLKKFFLATSVFLFLFGASLVQGGVYALENAKIIPQYSLFKKELKKEEVVGAIQKEGHADDAYENEDPRVVSNEPEEEVGLEDVSLLQLLAVVGYGGLVLYLSVRKNKNQAPTVVSS